MKQDIYECGMETIGGRWAQFNFRYYMYALLFVIFDVAVIFVYPGSAVRKAGPLCPHRDGGVHHHTRFWVGLRVAEARLGVEVG